MKALIDENLPHALAVALNALAKHDDNEVVHALDLVPRKTRDVELFRAIVDAKVRVHISQDHHDRRPIERDAIASSGLIVFVLNKGWCSQPFYVKAARLVLWWPRIMEHAEAMKPPAIFRVPWKISGKGRFEQVKLKR